MQVCGVPQNEGAHLHEGPCCAGVPYISVHAEGVCAYVCCACVRKGSLSLDVCLCGLQNTLCTRIQPLLTCLECVCLCVEKESLCRLQNGVGVNKHTRTHTLASPPQADLKTLALNTETFGTKFDVILIDPPWDEYARRAPQVCVTCVLCTCAFVCVHSCISTDTATYRAHKHAHTHTHCMRRARKGK